MEGENFIQKHYSEVALAGADSTAAKTIALKAGYKIEELKLIPVEASLGLGCGNSVGAAQPQEGEILLDLGCGAGMDLFLASKLLGPTGKAIGVDFTEEMVVRGRQLAEKYQATNVEFVHSPIENMPFEDNTFDVIISNCVLNLVEDKQAAFREIGRVLKKGGRFVISDILLKKEMPEDLQNDKLSISACIGRAASYEVYKKSLELVGLTDVEITDLKKDLNTLYSNTDSKQDAQICGACTVPCCGTGAPNKEDSVLMKYDLNEFGASCIVKARKE